MKSLVSFVQWDLGGRLLRSTGFVTAVMICERRWPIATGLLITLFYGNGVNEGEVADISKT